MNTLRESAQEYLAMRRRLGYKLRVAGKALLDFVSFLEQKKISYITTTLALEWAQEAPSARPGYRARRLSPIRAFARYRSATDERTEVPPLGLLPYSRSRPQPYLYTQREIECLLKACLQQKRSGSLRPWTYHCLFGLLAVAGLRISEALSLKVEDVNLEDDLLTVRETKFGKTRLVPIHPSTRKVLANYLRHRGRALAGRSSSHLFISPRTGGKLHVCVIQRRFREVSREVGLRAPDVKHGPRLHDFRHRFAVEALLRWYRSGQDVECRMPALSTYLGHTHVSDTYWYLSACPELMEHAARRLERRWEARHEK